MENANVMVRPAATSWFAVLGGWIATIGASVLFAPLVAALLAGAPANPNDLALAVPVILGLLGSYIVGGYVAGRMAGYRTSWHGMMAAFLSLFVVLVVMLLGYAADRGLFAPTGIRSLADLVPGVRDLNLYAFGDALTFGAILGFLAAIFGGWLGGVLAPSHAHAVRVVPAATSVERHEVVTSRSRPVLQGFGTPGRKGGDRMVSETEVAEEVHTTRVERG